MSEKFNNQIELDLAVRFYDSGIDHADKGNYVQSIADFTKVVQLNPGVGEAYYNRGISYLKLRSLDQAIADFTEYIKLNPNDSRPYAFRASAYSDQGKLKQALADLTKAVEINPKDFGALHNRAVVRFHLKDLKGARNDFNKVKRMGLKVNPEFEKILWSPVNNEKKYNLDKDFTDFVKSKYSNVEVIADILNGKTDFKNADFFFQNRNFIMELKSLEKDAYEDVYKIIVDLLYKKEIQTFPAEVKISEVLKNHPDNEKITQILSAKITASLEGAFEQANRQIRDTKKYFNLNKSTGVILIVNLDNTGLVPIIARNCLHQLFVKEKPEGGYRYEEISIIIYVSQVHFQPQEDKQTMMPFIVMLRKDEASEIEKAFLKEFTDQWENFTGVPIIDKGDQNSGDMLDAGPFLSKQKDFKNLSQNKVKKY
jgi:hypothetical protein